MKLQARWTGLVASAAAVVALLAVFALYSRPDFLLKLSDQLWACF